MAKRTIEMNGIGKSLELGRVNMVKLQHSEKEFIYLEKMDDGKWRLTYTEKTISEISKLKSMELNRNG